MARTDQHLGARANCFVHHEVDLVLYAPLSEHDREGKPVPLLANLTLHDAVGSTLVSATVGPNRISARVKARFVAQGPFSE